MRATNLPSMRSACLKLGLKHVVAQFSGRSDDITLDRVFGIPFTAEDDERDIENCSNESATDHDRMDETIWNYMLNDLIELHGKQTPPTHISGKIVYALAAGKIVQHEYLDPWELKEGDVPF